MYLARLYWMTIEFGLMETAQGRKIYGGGILSSPKETVYSLSGEPEYQAFDPVEAMRTVPHRHPATGVLRAAQPQAPVRPGPRGHPG